MSEEPIPKKRFDIINGSLSLTSVLSLLSACAIGVWTCSGTLSEINHKLEDHGAKITSQGSDIDTMKNQLWIIQGSQKQTDYVLSDMQRKLDRVDKKTSEN